MRIAASVKDALNRDPVLTGKNTSLNEAIKEMLSAEISHLLIVDGEKLVGIVSEKDILSKLATLRTWGASIGGLHISSFVKRKPFTLSPDTALKDAVRVMLKENLGAVPVMESGRLIGLLTKEDILRVLKVRSNMAVREIATHRLITLSPHDTLAYARRIIVERMLSSLPVVEGFKLLGVLTDIRTMEAVSRLYELAPWNVRRERFKKLLVQDVFERKCSCISPTESISSLVEQILEERAKSVLVVEGGNLLGIVTKSDVLLYMLQEVIES